MYKRIGDLEERVSNQDYLLDFLYAVLRASDAPSFNGQTMWPPHSRPGLQVHHLYARSNLSRELHFSVDETGWLDERRFDDIGNLTFILTQDNSDIGNESIEYLGRIPEPVRRAHLLRIADYAPGEFMRFIKDRRQLIRAAIEKYVSDREFVD